MFCCDGVVMIVFGKLDCMWYWIVLCYYFVDVGCIVFDVEKF